MAPEEELQASEPAAGEDATSVLMEVSRVIVRLHKEHFGRGPTSARSHWAGPDALVVLMEDTLTPAERSLVRMGAHKQLRDTREYFQYATVAEFCAPIEHITGRRVRSFHSSIDTKADGLAAELFIFYAEGQDGPSRIELAGDDEV